MTTRQTMRAVVLDAPGPPSALAIRELPVPVPEPGWVLIRVRAFGLNRSELHTRLGLAEGVTFPRVLGIEATGEVAQCPGGEFAPGQQVADGVEADRDRLQGAGAAAIAGDDRVEHRGVARVPADPDRPAGELARAVDGGRGDHRGQRPLDDRQDPDDVLAVLAGDGEVVDVEDREVGAAGLQQPDRVGRRRRRDHVQADAGGGVEMPGDRGVDADMDWVGGEVQDEGRAGRRVARAAGSATAGEGRSSEQDEEQRAAHGRPA